MLSIIRAHTIYNRILIHHCQATLAIAASSSPIPIAGQPPHRQPTNCTFTNYSRLSSAKPHHLWRDQPSPEENSLHNTAVEQLITSPAGLYTGVVQSTLLVVLLPHPTAITTLQKSLHNHQYNYMADTTRTHVIAQSFQPIERIDDENMHLIDNYIHDTRRTHAIAQSFRSIEQTDENMHLIDDYIHDTLVHDETEVDNYDVWDLSPRQNETYENFEEFDHEYIDGRTFDTQEAAHEFYDQYAFLNGFDTCKHNAHKIKATNAIFMRQFVCNK
ncbi:hypothetical protein RJ639_032758 [Escallonia herrerae]|uniref:Uncharacterized protein n=1 Tax=Escallonia herrerae TaxID=1293975 RepID=A0AA88WVC5_9ASTE|nr:hypothetical protein RJ639_032758 [Escallonia herrerae]